MWRLCCIKQKTAYELRISAWSSDVCSSDLPFGFSLFGERERAFARIFAAHQHRSFACIMLPEWRIGGDATLLDAERDALRCLHRQWRIARELFGQRTRGTEQVGVRNDNIDHPGHGGARGGERGPGGKKR